jgi:transposase-like protein
MAVERLKSCDNVLALAEELGVHRRLLYNWRDRLEPIDDGQAPPENGKERELRRQVAQLKRLVADKARDELRLTLPVLCEGRAKRTIPVNSVGHGRAPKPAPYGSWQRSRLERQRCFRAQEAR